jgi:putative flippase GtrA
LERLRAAAARPDTKTGKLARLVLELIKFGAVGGVAYVVDVGIYNLLVFGPGDMMGRWPVRAGLISAAIATGVSYLGNRYWTFSKKRSRMPVREIILFIVVNIGGIVIAQACLYFSRWVLDLHTLTSDNISRNIIGVGLGTIFRYLCYKFWVFNKPTAPKP